MNRRHFLRASGIAIGLPFFESLAQTSHSTPPKRFAFIYTPNGYNQAAYVPKTTGLDWEVTPTLEPLAGLRNHVAVITGLDRQFVGGTGVHAQCGSCWMTSSSPQETLDGGFPTNTTLDQLIARHIGSDSLLPSLELSCNDFTDNKETRYYECVSWYAPGYAANVEKNPRTVFQRLFGQPDGDATRSVLDAVMGDVKALNARLGRSDQTKLDEYLESVRATERRIQTAEKIAKRLKRPALEEPAGIPESRLDYLRLQAELMVLAFQNDLTRVASLVVDPERWDSPRMFDGLFERPQNHHVLTHTKGDEAKAMVAKIDRYHVELFAHVVQRLKEIPEGNGSLLDSTTVVMGSGLSDGDQHHYADLQVLMAGGGWKNGHFHFAGKRPLADLWLTMAQRSGLKMQRFADSTGAIPALIG